MKKFLVTACIFCGLWGSAIAFPLGSTGKSVSIGTQTVADVASTSKNSSAVFNSVITSFGLTPQWSIVFKPSFAWGTACFVNGAYQTKLLAGAQFSKTVDATRTTFIQILPGYANVITDGWVLDTQTNAFASEVYSEIWIAKILNLNLDMNLLAGVAKPKKLIPYTAVSFNMLFRPLFLVADMKPFYFLVGPIGSIGCASNATDDIWQLGYRVGAVMQFKASLTRNALAVLISCGYDGTQDKPRIYNHGGFFNIEFDSAFW